ncbi:MAG TPA: ABC transporter permease [Thermoanaerobaculia bacterium]|jgi:putative ABC transport system permease protein|nr:ABC transporter permease [Thermoanaerobaculia bacterium]
MRNSITRLGNITVVGLKSIARNKLRSLLTALGVVIGVACVIVSVAIGAGVAQSVSEMINSLGSNYIMVMPGAATQGGARIFTGSSNLTEDDAEAIRREAPAVAYVSPQNRTAGQVVATELNWSTQVFGVGVDWPFIRAWNVEDGGFFTDQDVRSGAKVAVLGKTVADNLFPAGGAVGSSIRIKNVPFRVVGVLEKKGGNMMGNDQDDAIIAPYTTVQKRLQGQGQRIGMIMVSAASAEQVQEAMDQIDALLRQRHRIPPGGDADFMMRSQEEIAQANAQQVGLMRNLLLGIAIVSLFVGGIGIMNIMLVSVTERTREIGIRMAIGARGRHVLLQFLFEAIVLSVCGGLIGILLGVGVATLFARVAKWPIVVSPMAILIAFAVAATIGIFFGFYPARKAARLDPIDALRYE